MLKSLSDCFNFESENIANLTTVNTFHIVVSIYMTQQSTMLDAKPKTAKRAHKLMFLWVKHADQLRLITEPGSEKLCISISQELSLNLISNRETFRLSVNEKRFCCHNRMRRASHIQCIAISTIVL